MSNIKDILKFRKDDLDFAPKELNFVFTNEADNLVSGRRLVISVEWDESRGKTPVQMCSPVYEIPYPNSTIIKVNGVEIKVNKMFAMKDNF